MNIQTIADFRRAMRHGPYTFPGCYPVYFIMADGEALSFEAARENVRELLESFTYNVPCWRPVALEVNWEDSELRCAHTNEPIESAYGRDDVLADYREECKADYQRTGEGE